MDTEMSAQMLEFFKALADIRRLRIVGMLAEHPCTTAELARRLALKPPAVAHHVAMLSEAGLVRITTDEGVSNSVVLDIERLQALRRAILQADTTAEVTASSSGTAAERKVLRDFFEGDRLKSIPTAAGKRAVILHWFAAQFTPDTRYQEREVNELLLRHSADSNTLRRLLIDHRLLCRTADGRVYWRPAAEESAPSLAPVEQ